MHRTASAALIVLFAAGCMGPAAPDADLPAAPAVRDGFLAYNADGVSLAWAPGAVSRLTNVASAAFDVTLPPGTLRVDNGGLVPLGLQAGAFDPAPATLTLPAGASLSFVTSPGSASLNATVAGRDVSWTFPEGPRARLLDGAAVLAHVRTNEAEFPDRNPGTESYAKALAWAAARFEAAGYEVTMDEYGVLGLPQDVCPPVPVSGQQACPASFANVVATKPGADPLGPVIVVGGHYDIVPQVTYGAYDNTAGAMAVLSLAEAMAPFQFNATLVFALWGGEESGLLGSTSWLLTHPHLRPRIAAYWNFDVIGMSWPAARPAPTPLYLHVGPEAGTPVSPLPDPLQSALVDWATALQQDWMRYPSEDQGRPAFAYSGLAEDVVTSDNLAFSSLGIPTFVPESYGGVSSAYRIHEETDTLANMTKYAWHGAEADYDAPLDPADAPAAEALLARSFEPYLGFAFYHIVLADAGLFQPYPA